MAAKRRSEVKKCLEAASRKIEIAEYHLRCLRSALADSARPDEPPVPVPVQAHFEGVLDSVIAASEQVDEATKLEAQDHRDRRRRLFQRTWLEAQSPSIHVALREWSQEPIAEDVRLVRNKATHHHYQKTPTGTRLEVEKPGRAYPGSRALDEYSAAACEHFNRLRSLINEIERVLSMSVVEWHRPSGPRHC